MWGISRSGDPEPGQEPKPWKQTRVIGKPMPRVDAYERVSGSALYPSDVTFPDVLYGVVLGSPHANARFAASMSPQRSKCLASMLL